jgi:hypothetical protein
MPACTTWDDPSTHRSIWDWHTPTSVPLETSAIPSSVLPSQLSSIPLQVSVVGPMAACTTWKDPFTQLWISVWQAPTSVPLT